MNETRVRRTRSDGERSRGAILREAAKLATTEGIDGLSIGRLARAVGMSKSGLIAHFGTKQELQLATIETASAIFAVSVMDSMLDVFMPLVEGWSEYGASSHAPREPSAPSM